MAVDVVSNAFSYSLVGLDDRQPLLAGVGAVTRPGSTRLGDAPTSRRAAGIYRWIGSQCCLRPFPSAHDSVEWIARAARTAIKHLDLVEQ
ncbi:hypothetical protein CLV58_11836 [Spirosoma oryzae]|uniref:Uncharacterized protein n=1 Tax=Spirosoma oryzae TaxID=1469603 RepID=A0A2T0SL92_9BACT|nr:hypothetical protein CLV58_11836 [Spirosoma oryzae]